MVVLGHDSDGRIAAMTSHSPIASVCEKSSGPGAAARHIPQVLSLRYGPAERLGWSPRLRRRFGYCNPDEWYEATLFDLVDARTDWLDVGCGRDLFPSNPRGAKVLAGRCRLLVGLDPSDNIDDNPLIHERAKCRLEEYQPDRWFDLITLRMVAEHIAEPAASVAALARLAKPGGLVVVYTVAKFSPVTLVSAMTPLRVHHLLKRLLWRTEERDTFPTVYRMNTRRALGRLFGAAGFREESFRLLDDCRTFGRWKALTILELVAWKGLRGVGLRYPDACILALFRKSG